MYNLLNRSTFDGRVLVEASSNQKEDDGKNHGYERNQEAIGKADVLLNVGYGGVGNEGAGVDKEVKP